MASATLNQSTRERILDAVVVVMQRDPTGYTIPQVAKEAGVAVPTVYRHFASKKALFDGLRERAEALDGAVVQREGITLEEARARRCATIPVRRYGTIEEFGAACAFLCSTHAGFIVGQNILLDGGGTNATI